MAQFLVLCPSYLKVGNEALPRPVAAETTIDFLGLRPGSSLYALDAAGRAVVTAAKPAGGSGARIQYDARRTHLLASLSRQAKALVTANPGG
jgi:hypothetical protein